ncbi:hypothetical protein JTE90_020925 [Oedothorax gibbosus]|uniref:PHTF1/2 N-terminal domain-containing protein n=1 Tax=Oedothorax gibbosus TaxID=931172 RepID=A0AAV6VNP6_9ARAC|nr:hypothetical protein JTE90_020925 [Oedothorax gibbosus]
MSLTSALNWYHKKIGAYDKELWEKSVDQRILRGVCAIPKKTTRIKTELIDVDLVRGSAFAKAKPQHNWIAATVSGIKRVFLLPLFYSWWKVQTSALVSCTLVILYFLQIVAAYLYFSADEKEFPDVPVSEILTPVLMTFTLGVVHSQIVATFTTTKARKHVAREKRRRKRTKKPHDYDRESKSSPDSASEERRRKRTKKPDCYCKSKSLPDSASEERHEIQKHCTKPLEKHDFHNSRDVNNTNCGQCHPCGCKRFNKTGRLLRFSVDHNTRPVSSNEESGVDNSDFIDPLEECDNLVIPKSIPLHIPGINSHTDNITSITSSNESTSAHKSSGLPYHVENLDISFQQRTSQKLLSSNLKSQSIHPDKISFSTGKDQPQLSSDEEFFVTRKSTHSSDQSKNHTLENKNSCNVPKLCENNPRLLSTRRYSDDGTSCKNPKVFQAVFLSLQDQSCLYRRSEDNILVDDLDLLSEKKPFSNIPLNDSRNSDVNSVRRRFRVNGSSDGVPLSLKLPINIKNFSSSCESGADTSPNTTSKPQTSDLEWPLITNTDCNSDSTDCSTQCSEGNVSDISPTENPFAWEIQEPSKKLSNIGYNGTDKGYRPKEVSCTIWEHNECKKADLTALDISSAIIQKVDSSHHSGEYLYIGMFVSMLLALLPLLFRLRNGVSTYIIPDVTTDVLNMGVPSSAEVVKITDGLLDVMLGPGWRVKLVVLIVMLERFILSLAYFFLLSVAEKTFKQRFLYAKHFCYLTSSRRAKRSDLPHFRLNKVRNIKIWLSIRSYMKKLGPQRSVDVIVSIAFILEVCVVSLLCIQLLNETGQFADKLYCWELLFWTLALGMYLLRYMVIGTKINKKYRNLSVLITEQINLYLHMEQKPHKKEELMLANNVLKLAADLLKELESPFKISGLCANSYLYNITKVVVLSAFSAVLTDVLGFKLKLYKIKLK